MTTPPPPAYAGQPGPADLLDNTTVSAVRSSRGPLRTGLIVGAVVLALSVAGAAYGVEHYLGGGGAQPADVLPASAVAVVTIDLDPSLGQKKAIYDLSRKFPSAKAKTKSAESVKNDLLTSVFQDDPQGVRYDRDIKPWLGKRVAVAAVPDGTGLSPVVALQYTDRSKAAASLTRLIDRDRAAPNAFHYAFSGDYALLARTQADADRYAGQKDHLAGNASFSKAVAALDGDQIAIAWADVKGLYAAVPKDRLAATPFFSRAAAHPSGSFVVGLHADSSYLEVQGKAVGVVDSLVDGGSTRMGNHQGGNLLAPFPRDSAVAVEDTGLGETVTRLYSSLVKQVPPELTQGLEQMGLALPGDLKVLLGNDTAGFVAAGPNRSTPSVAVHVRTDDPKRAVSILDRIGAKARADGSSVPFVVRAQGDGYLIGSGKDSLDAAGSGDLGRSGSFRTAVPDAQSAGFALYVDINRVAAMAGAPSDADLRQLDAFGMTANPATGSFRLRLTAK